VTDRESTIGELKERIRALVVDKGWGKDGVQNPQQVSMAMTVEMSELLEHFQWLDERGVAALLAGEDQERVAKIAEEYADVMMYGLQLCYSLGIDLSAAIERKIEIVRGRPNGSISEYQEYKRTET